jgi:tetratricopeptide (TPR) repeat protein
VGVDRDSAVRKAEELVRDGKIDLAIDEYVRLVDEQPGDVGAANALGDLYAKAGNRAAAVAQFVQIGDNHRDSGFVPKAVAFYKKALKVDPGSDHALSQLAQIAVGQELYADATLYLNRLLQRRREQNNEAGVAECLVRLGGFPSATADAKLAAARAGAAHVAQDQAARLWTDAADALERADRARDALDALMQAATLEPDDVSLRSRVALACATTGQIDRARAFLSFETAGDHPDLLFALAEHALADGRDGDARRALERVLEVAPDRRTEAEAMLAPLAVESGPAVTHQIPADFFAVDVHQTAEPDADVPIDLAAAFGSGSEAAAEVDSEDPAEPVVLDEETPPVFEYGIVEPQVFVADAPQPESAGPEAFEPEAVEFQVVEQEIAEPAVAEPAVEALEPEPVIAPSPDSATAADLESIAALTAAAQNPALQFQASAQLGRLLLRLGRSAEGIEWLERATHAGSPVRDQQLDAMYELADALERSGQRRRALDVFADLDFDAASFRDVPERMAALRSALGEGGAT